MAQNIQKMIAETFLEMAQGLQSGSYGKRPKIALTGMGSEHGEENSMAAAVMAASEGIDVYYIGTLEAPGVYTVKVADDEEGHKKMEELLEKGEDVNYEATLDDIKKRDYNDTHRKLNPLAKADDAIEVDTTDMTIDEVVQTILDQIK